MIPVGKPRARWASGGEESGEPTNLHILAFFDSEQLYGGSLELVFAMVAFTQVYCLPNSQS